MSRTPEQQAAITTASKYLCVDAGAGSGKTLVLVDRVVHLLETRQASLDEIVAITFTDKAADEMKDRLRAAFHAKAPMDDPALMSFWRDLERRVETARVSTIHSFCGALLRENALDIGIDPDFTVLAEAEAKLLKDEVITDALHDLLDAGDEAALRAGAEWGTGRLAGALAGLLNQRPLLERLRGACPLGDPDELAQHWADLVAQEHARRIEALAVSKELPRLRDELRTFDGECLKTADKREVMRIEMLDALDEILSGAGVPRIEARLEQIAVLKATGTSKGNWTSPEVHERLSDLEKRFVDLAKDHARPVVDAAVEHAAARLTCDVFAVYEKVAEAFRAAKGQRISVDFDDHIAGALAILRGNGPVRAKVARGVKHLLIDEFQDTDAAQLELARLLADEPDGPALFIVGDAKQSIYDFRGAEVEVFQGEQVAADALIRLDRNFRSLPDVLAFVNEFFTASGGLAAVEPVFRPLNTHRAPVGESRVTFLIPEPIEGGKAEDYRRAEAGLIAARIAELCGETAPGLVYDKGGELTRPASFGDVALLFRAMGDVHLYEDQLRRRGIPYQVVAGAGFYERQEIRDVRNLLTVVADPWDEMALLGFLRGPMAALSDESLLRLCADGGLASVFQGNASPAGLGAAEAARFDAARALIADLRAHGELALPAFLRYALSRTAYEAILLSQFLGVQKASNVRKVLDLADDFARTRLPKLGAFVRYLDELAQRPEIREGDAALGAEGAVTLMTIHKAKGLEFPVVFVVDCSRGLKGDQGGLVTLHRRLGMAVKATDAQGEPASPALLDAMARDRKVLDAAEHARVLYVAMTRARDWLFLSGAPEAGKGASKGSWMDAFHAAYGVLERADGAEFSGGGWRARVLRAPGDAHLPGWPGDASPVLPEAQLQARVGSVAGGSGRYATLAVTTLLDAMEPHEPEPVQAAPWRSPGAMDPRVRGQLVHELFESWDGASDPEPFIEAICRRECLGAASRAALAADLTASAERFVQSSLGRRIAAEGVVFREHPFLLRVGDRIVEGQLDAMLADGTIVDYKTGRPHASGRARYEAQLCLYAAAVRALTQQAPPAAFLYYVDTGEVQAVDVSRERIEAVLTEAAGTIEAVYGDTGN